LYLNGEKVIERAVQVVFDGSDVLLGAYRGGDIQEFWAGALDELRIYDRALSDLEVREVVTDGH
jgi:hypothetical protein